MVPNSWDTIQIAPTSSICDLRDTSSARDVAITAVEMENDIVINNEGTFPFGPKETTEERFDIVFSLNVHGLWVGSSHDRICL